MQFERHSAFKRQWRKLPQKLREKMQERLMLLFSNEFDKTLNNHKLNPPFDGYRSINITGDYRLIYKHVDSNTVYLRAIGTHHQLYRD